MAKNDGNVVLETAWPALWIPEQTEPNCNFSAQPGLCTVSQNAPEPTKKLLPVILLTYFWWKLWMTSSKTLGIWKFGARPWERPVKAKTLKYCSQGNKDETKFCLYRCTLYPKLFIGLPWTPVVNYFLNWSTVLSKITIWKSGKCQNHTEGRPFLMN